MRNGDEMQQADVRGGQKGKINLWQLLSTTMQNIGIDYADQMEHRWEDQCELV